MIGKFVIETYKFMYMYLIMYKYIPVTDKNLTVMGHNEWQLKHIP